jgi:Zn-dependent M28 family amino/carboxypeptidase
MLSLARAFAKQPAKRTIRFVAFANEEPPYFQTANMGSYRYAQRCRERGERIIAMISLETIGYFNEAKGSQQYPAMLGAIYPDTATFIAFASNVSSRAVMQRSLDVFRRHAKVGSEGAALPEAVTGIAFSDQWSFWRAGYPAFMVTDTAFFRNPNYHSANDTPQTLDYARLTRVVEGLLPVVAALAND